MSKRVYMKKPTHQCSNCGGTVQPRKPSKTGLHFCSKPDCNREKVRAHYRLAAGPVEDREWLSEICSNPECSAGENGHAKRLPRRRRRVNDSKLGRWCPARACQRHRRGVEHQASLQVSADEKIKSDFLEALAFEERVECECGREDAVPGFKHFDPWMNVCDLTGGGRVPGDIALRLWGE